jgi:uncharacterized membrane protein
MFIIVFLPIIITIWMTGWILTQIGDLGKPIEISPKTLKSNAAFKKYVKESEEPEKDSRIANEPLIVT